jgi:chromosome segregation ATPase
MKTTEITNLKEQIKKLTSVLNNMTKNQDDNVNKLNAEIKHLKETGISIVEERDKIKKELDNTKYELDNVKDQATEQLKEYGQNALIKIQNYQSIIDKLKQNNEELFIENQTLKKKQDNLKLEKASIERNKLLIEEDVKNLQKQKEYSEEIQNEIQNELNKYKMLNEKQMEMLKELVSADELLKQENLEKNQKIERENFNQIFDESLRKKGLIMSKNMKDYTNICYIFII